jgi:hypothetical protein
MPASFTNYGSLNGTTPVLLQAPPDQGSLLVRELYIRNIDTMPVGLHVYASDGIKDVEVFGGILRVGYTLQMSHHDVIVLNTSTGLYAVLDAPVVANQPTYKIGFAFENQI